jgi:S-disulfanyl-L-cysteine oxidoreductase SoxD
MRYQILPALMVFMTMSLGAQAQPRQSVWDGVYTEEQAGRGQTYYQQSCGRCHGANLAGTFETPPLMGRFIPYWSGTTMDVMFDYVSTAMPLDRPGSLGPTANAAIVAYLLKANGFPAGTKEFGSTADVQKTISFDSAPPRTKKRAR